MFEQEDKEGGFEQVEFDSHELIAGLLGTMETVEMSCKDYVYYTLDADDTGDRIGECPRGANWSCHHCYMKTVIYEQLLEPDNENSPKEEHLICTPYAISDIRIGMYENPKQEGDHFGMFVKDHLIMELGTEKPTILLEHEIDLCSFLIHASDSKLQN